ncbi:MAG: hypothetical protein ABFC63_06295 [Thermoguttaceae bacterium]
MSPEIANLLVKVKQLLEEQAPEKAIDAISRSKLSSPWLTNAIGVCAMRLGNITQAAGLFQSLVGHSGVMLRRDTPVVFRTNYATALLASNNLAGCLSVLHEIGHEDDPTIVRLRAAIREWKRSLSWWQRLRWYSGDSPKKPVTLDFSLGELD